MNHYEKTLSTPDLKAYLQEQEKELESLDGKLDRKEMSQENYDWWRAVYRGRIYDCEVELRKRRHGG